MVLQHLWVGLIIYCLFMLGMVHTTILSMLNHMRSIFHTCFDRYRPESLTASCPISVDGWIELWFKNWVVWPRSNIWVSCIFNHWHVFTLSRASPQEATCNMSIDKLVTLISYCEHRFIFRRCKSVRWDCRSSFGSLYFDLWWCIFTKGLLYLDLDSIVLILESSHSIFINGACSYGFKSVYTKCFGQESNTIIF